MRRLSQSQLSILLRRRYIIFLIDLSIPFPVTCRPLPFFQGFKFLELLLFDHASKGSALLDVDDQQLRSTSVASQLQRMKDLLSAPISILVHDSNEVKHLSEEIKPQLLEVLQIKL
jgi:hypothetical protein